MAGSEAAIFLANQGIAVTLAEMRPLQTTEAHKTSGCAELVCSNSLKSKVPHSAPGILKEEMRQLGSIVLQTADQHAVPSGDALSVDRDAFSASITEKISTHPLITRVSERTDQVDENEITLVATGPLTTPELTQWIAQKTGNDDFYFYDAIAPIIDATTIDPNSSFIQNRYDKGGDEAYINCPLTESEYHAFLDALLAGDQVPSKNFEKEIFFQGCQPIEAIAATGRDTLRFGPMKPVGLTDPRTGTKPYANVQLRPENRAKTAYNMVGFQTKLKYGSQLKALRLIPALKNAEFLRMGSIHRNSFICAPKVLSPDLSLKSSPKTYFAGQITGVEGYLESAACGLMAAVFISQRIRGRTHSAPPANTAFGALLSHLTLSSEKNYQPNNIQFSLFDPLYFDLHGIKGREPVREAMAKQCSENFSSWRKSLGF